MTVICTLFENHLHNGVVGLVNSLYNSGFRGQIFAGYKGTLPKWAHNAKEHGSTPYGSIRTLDLKGLKLNFLSLDTDFHLANYKPTFMLNLLHDLAKDCTDIIYFDPDIVVKCEWQFFERWMKHGVALVHEISGQDMPPTHPIRLDWEGIIEKMGRKTVNNLHSYFNSGFCGVSRKNISFIRAWSEIIQFSISHFNFDPAKFITASRSSTLAILDQDTFNIAAMCCEAPVSEIGPEGMDFIPGGWLLSHAIGKQKPWNKKFIISAFKGISPSTADRAYWAQAQTPIYLHSSLFVKMKRIQIGCAALIGRFYARK